MKLYDISILFTLLERHQAVTGKSLLGIFHGLKQILSTINLLHDLLNIF